MQVSAGGGLGYHVVWCPKCRCPVPVGRVGGRCEELVSAKASEHGWRTVLELMPGHVHLFVKAHPSGSSSRIARHFKGFTPRQLRAGFLHLQSRLRALRYSAAAAGAMPAQTGCRYGGAQDGRRWWKERVQ
jgi:putative transposase